MAIDPLEEIRTLYFNATRATIQRDFDRAVDLLKSMATDDERSRAHVYMDGLAAMRTEWGGQARPGPRGPGKPGR